MQHAYLESCMTESCETNGEYYDRAYFEGPFEVTPQVHHSENDQNGSSHQDLADELKADLARDCDSECMQRGCRWSLIYKYNTLAMFLLTV